MKKIIIIWFLAVMAICAQDMRRNSFASLFADQKAVQIGDAVTILVVESSQASNNAETSTGRQSSIGLNGSLQAGKSPGTSLEGSLGTTNDFSGTGSTKTTGLVRTKISATVDSVLSNGNLHIQGSRKIVINGEEQNVKIKGIVRTSDILSDNSILSYNISEAEIVFEGSGLIDNAQKPGWITKFLHWLF
ncbi:MAG: flagellar basal body L-ring protein FlgH [Bacteroidota bacterium]|nr:flagellar basal body L-ring protein FlgH [Bacteroidota bacterium]